MGKMIINSGAPATGKTTLSRNLSERFSLPLINKDELKELLFDNLGDRHPGHIRLTGGFEGYKGTIINRPFKLEVDGSLNVDIDTTKFKDIDFEGIYDKVEGYLGRNI